MRRHILDSPASYYGTFFVACYLPVNLSRWLAKVVALIIYAFSKKDREGLALNLSTALDRPVDDPTVKRTVRQVFLNYGRYMVDFFLLPQQPPEKIKK
jgi:lauroyl/myristoyl acyltransferase